MSKEYRREKEDLEQDDDSYTGKNRKGSAHKKHDDDVNRRKRESKNLSREREGKAADND